MRKTILVVLTLLTITSFAQKIKVTESTENIGGGKNSAFAVNIYNSTQDDIGNRWRSLMKSYKGKVKMGKEIFADNAVITTINDNNTIDIYAKIEKGDDNALQLVVAYDLGGAFLSSANNKEKVNAAKNLIYDFAVKISKEGIVEQRKSAEKALTDLEDDQHDLVKAQQRLVSNTEDYKQKIEEYKQKIKDTEGATAKNKTEQEKKKQEIAAQQKVVNDIVAKEKAVQ